MGASANQNPNVSMTSGFSAAVIATAPAGGWTARARIMTTMAKATDNAIRPNGSATNKQTATPTSAASVLPTTADHGCASGLLGTAKSSTALAPNGATK